MSGQRRFGLALSWPRVTSVFVLDVAVLALVSHLPAAWQTDHIAWWVGVAVVIAVTVVGLVSYHRNTFASAMFSRMLDRFADPQAMLTTGRTPAVDHHRRYGREVVGIREYQGLLVSAIAVESPDDVAVGRHRPRESALATLPLDLVVDRLRQFDVRLDEIDIVSVGVRSADADSGQQSEEPPGFDEHRTWLVLRMDPLRNVAAVAARDSLAATLAAATERLALDLDGRYCAARPVTADEFAELDAAVLAGLEPARVSARRRRLKHNEPAGPNEYVTSFWVSPQDISTDTLERLWSPEARAAAVTVKLTARRGGADVSVWVRYHSSQRFGREAWRGLHRLTGRQLAAVSASLPVPTRRPALVVPGRALAPREHLSVPVTHIPQPATPAPAGAHW